MITNTSRLLSALTATEPFITCYVDGCYKPVVVGRRHKVYGHVDACAGHDPDRHGYALPFWPAPPSQAPVLLPFAEDAVESPSRSADAKRFETLALVARGLAELFNIEVPGDTPRRSTDDGEGGGGRPAPLVPPTPNLPPSGRVRRRPAARG